MNLLIQHIYIGLPKIYKYNLICVLFYLTYLIFLGIYTLHLISLPDCLYVYIGSLEISFIFSPSKFSIL